MVVLEIKPRLCPPPYSLVGVSCTPGQTLIVEDDLELLKNIYFVYVYMCASMYTRPVQCLQSSEEGIRYQEPVTSGRECWDLNLSPREKHKVLLTVVIAPAPALNL